MTDRQDGANAQSTSSELPPPFKYKQSQPCGVNACDKYKAE